LQLLPGGRSNHVRDIGGVESSGNLCIQVDPVHHDHHRGVAELPVHSQFLRGKDHQQRLARALEMPDQPLFWIAIDHSGYQQIRCFVLLIAADDLDAPVLFVGGKQGETLQDVQHDVRLQHRPDGALDVSQCAFGLVARLMPWPPYIDGHAHRAISVALALGGKGKDIGHKHLRHALLVAVVDVAGPIHPGDRRAHRGLGLADDQREAVHQ